MMNRTRLASLLATGLAWVLAGCATTQMTAEWRDPAFTAASLKGKRLLVLCRAPDETMRRVCEDQWMGQLATQGMALVPSYSVSGFPVASADGSEEMRSAVRASGAAALVSVSLQLSDVAVVNPGPQVGIGIGGGSGGGYRSGGFSVGGIGISLPIGSATATQGLGANASLVDAATGKLVWSGSASTPASSDVSAQVGALTQVTVEAMRKAGLI
jgi:hypothetical protein